MPRRRRARRRATPAAPAVADPPITLDDQRLLHLVRQLERQLGIHHSDQPGATHWTLPVLQPQHDVLQRLKHPRFELNAWYDSRGQENADKCAWTFGATYSAANGSQANMNLGTMDYRIQRNWVNANGGYCALSY